MLAAGEVGIVIGGSQGKSTIQYNTMSNSAKYGIACIGNFPDMTIKGNKIVNLGLYGISDTGSKAYWTSRSNVSENIIEDTRTTYIMKYAIYQGHSSVTWTVKNNEIPGCTIYYQYT
jgi:hypothetical protein